MPRFRLGADVGGTFTDLVLSSDAGHYAEKKVLSTPDAYWRAVVEGSLAILSEAGVGPEQVSEICHATTVATNAVLERSGPKTGLLTTQGFRDVLELRRMRFPDTYNLMWEKPDPLVDRYLRQEVIERIDARGRVLEPIDAESVLAAIHRLVEGEKVESIAVALINSPVNPAHEQAVRGLIEARYPEVFVSLSSEVLTELREYERTSTTVLNAYLQPLLTRYLARMAEEMQKHGLSAPIYVMQSAGGVMTMDAACRFPVHVLESGPAAGIMGAAHVLAEVDDAAAVTFDMGGTTAKAAMIEGRRPVKGSEFEIGAPISIASRVLKGGGYLVRVPAIDVAEVGAGGGSIASVDEGGAFKVGPRSAGSVPGPACYGLGGAEPTVTDANLSLGILGDDGLLGGAMPLDRGRADSALSTVASPSIGEGLHLAEGVRAVAVNTMARAVRAVSTERGRDVRQAILVAFGGNGPVHAAALADNLGIVRVLVPRSAGVFSALGLLYSGHEWTFVRPFQVDLSDVEPDRLAAALREVQETAQAEVAAGNVHGTAEIVGFADIRYRGQASELRIALPTVDAITPHALRVAFETEYQRTFGHDQPEAVVRVVNVGCTATIASAALNFGPEESVAPSERRTRPVCFSADSGFIDTVVLPHRNALATAALPGPLLIEEYDSTTVVPLGWTASLTGSGSILLQKAGA